MPESQPASPRLPRRSPFLGAEGLRIAPLDATGELFEGQTESASKPVKHADCRLLPANLEQRDVRAVQLAVSSKVLLRVLKFKPSGPDFYRQRVD